MLISTQTTAPDPSVMVGMPRYTDLPFDGELSPFDGELVEPLPEPLMHDSSPRGKGKPLHSRPARPVQSERGPRPSPARAPRGERRSICHSSQHPDRTKPLAGRGNDGDDRKGDSSITGTLYVTKENEDLKRRKGGNARILRMSHTSISTARPLDPQALNGDQIQPDHPLFGIVWINPNRMSGAPCFAGTRVPIKNLFDYLEGGESLDDFLEGFPGVTREQAIAVIELARNGF